MPDTSNLEFLSDVQDPPSYRICGSLEAYKRVRQQRQGSSEKDNSPTPPKYLNQLVYSRKEKKPALEQFLHVDLSPEEVRKEVATVVHRLSEQKRKDRVAREQRKCRLPRGDQFFLSKEHRVIKRHSDSRQRWDRLVESSCEKVERSYEESVYHDVDGYRSRVEQKELLDQIQTDAEKYGNAMWVLYTNQSSTP